MSKVYKVVLAKLRQETEQDNVTLRSALTPDLYELEYTQGVTHLPVVVDSFLYAFKDLPSAQAYVGGREETVLSAAAVLRVYSAEADVVVGMQPVYTLMDIQKFWRERWWEYGSGWPHVIPCPPGTVWCRSIKLLDEEWNDGRALKAKPKPMKKEYSPASSYQRKSYRY